MTLTEILIVKLGSRLGKILLKSYLRDPAEALGEDLLEVAKGRIENLLDRREAKRQFEKIGERIAVQLEPLFEHEFQRDQTSVEAVILEIAKALDGRISAEFFLSRDLDPAKLQAELKRLHPLPGSQFSNAEEELYDRALSEIVRYVVEVAAKLPRFEVTQVKESLQRLSRLEEVVGETARNVEHIKNWVSIQEGNASNRHYEIEYRLAVTRKLDFLELFGADLTPESRRQALSVAYVSLTLETGSDSDSGVPTPVEDVLAGLGREHSCLMIRGEAGSGKSTLFRWAAIQAARGVEVKLQPGGIARDAPTWDMLFQQETGELSAVPPWRRKIPFLVRLRDCKGGKLPAPEELPALMAKEIGVPPAFWVLSILKEGRGLLLFDGLDEIPNIHRETVRQELEALIHVYPKNLFLVSTRPEAAAEDWLRFMGFHEARVNPMSDLDRSRFIDKWHEAVAVELRRIGKPADDLPALAAELKRQLPENPSVGRLATNPLLCAMICALHRDRSQKLPESPSELCEYLCEVLLHRRERESNLDISEFPEAYRSLTYPQKRIIVQEIAHSMVLNGEFSIKVERATEKVGVALSSLMGRSTADAEVVCKTLVERSGMLKETKQGHLDFIHNTFKEYLAGERFADSGDVGILVEHALDATWQRVILFAVATTRKGYAEEVIGRLLQREVEASDGAEKRACQLLAFQCREAALLISPQVESRLDGIAREFLPPRNLEDAEALAKTGEMAVPFLRYQTSLGAMEAAACVRALRLIGTPRARALLEGFFADLREPVVSELCQAVNPLLLRAIQERLLEGEALGAGISRLVSDISPLSHFTSLQSLNLGETRVSDISPLSGLHDLRVLSLYDTPVADLSPLAGLVGLQVLDLSRSQVSSVARLSNLKNLRALSLSRTPVSDISPLSALNNLETLDLSATPILDASPLSPLTNLRQLYLSTTKISDVSPLSRMESLEMLFLGDTPLADVSPLSSLRRLQALFLSGTQVSDLSPLSSVRGLQILLLHKSKVFDIAPLAEMSQLTTLSLNSTPVSDFSPLRVLGALRRLVLDSRPDLDLSMLSGLPDLQVVRE